MAILGSSCGADCPSAVAGVEFVRVSPGEAANVLSFELEAASFRRMGDAESVRIATGGRICCLGVLHRHRGRADGVFKFPESPVLEHADLAAESIVAAGLQESMGLGWRQVEDPASVARSALESKQLQPPVDDEA